jgi:hypothetical protein
VRSLVVAVVVVVLCARAAVAQVAAMPAPAAAAQRQPVREWCDCEGELGIEIGGGGATESGRPTAGLGRIDTVAVLAPHREVGLLVAMHLGMEYWTNGPDQGFDTPFGVSLGARVFPFRITIGVGTDLFLVDRVAASAGFGMYAPYASARLGVSVGGWSVTVDARATYRWQFFSASRGQYTAALMIGRTLRTRR